MEASTMPQSQPQVQETGFAAGRLLSVDGVLEYIILGELCQGWHMADSNSFLRLGAARDTNLKPLHRLV